MYSSMYCQIGQDNDLVKQINKMYRMDMDATSTTLDPGGGDEDEYRALAASDGVGYASGRGGAGGGGGRVVGTGGPGGVPKSLRVRGSAAARGVVRVYNAVARCLRDDRIEDADEETVETFRRINAKNDDSFPASRRCSTFAS
jgi:hypothetical protein